jgi:hypothetical protein
VISRLGLFVLALVGVSIGAEGIARVVEASTDTEVVIWYDEATQLKVAQMAERSGADVVVVGTSMAWQGLVPDALAGESRGSTVIGGRGVYNAALAGGVPTVIEPWLTDEVVTSLKPSVVLWGLSSLDFSEVYGQAGLDAYSGAVATRGGALAEADRGLRQVSAVFRQRALLRNPSLLFGSDRTVAAARFAEARQTLGPGGERLDFTPAVTDDRALEVRTRISPYQPDREDIAAVVRTVENLRDRGIEVIFVELPVPPRFVDLYDRGPREHEQIAVLLQLMADELEVTLLTAGDEYGDADFVDFTHLDEDAARRFSVDIGTQLAALRR